MLIKNWFSLFLFHKLAVYYKIMKVFIFLFNTSDEHSLLSIEKAYETVKKNTLG